MVTIESTLRFLFHYITWLWVEKIFTLELFFQCDHLIAIQKCNICVLHKKNLDCLQNQSNLKSSIHCHFSLYYLFYCYYSQFFASLADHFLFFMHFIVFAVGFSPLHHWKVLSYLFFNAVMCFSLSIFCVIVFCAICFLFFITSMQKDLLKFIFFYCKLKF